MYYIIYHQAKKNTDCPDGIMAAAVVALHFEQIPLLPDEWELIGDVYRNKGEYETEPDIEQYPFKKGDEVHIVDFSYPLNWLKYWEDKGVRLTVIDHHESKFEMLSGFTRAILNKDECGATLAWKHYFIGNPLPELLKEVRRRDIGKDGYYDGLIRESEAINEGLSQWRHNFLKYHGDRKQMLSRIGEILMENSNGYSYTFHQTLELWGLTKLEERDKIIEQAISRSEFKILEEYEVPFVRLEKHESRYYSMIGNNLAKAYPECSFAWVETEDGGQHLRSCNGFDTRPIAQKYGGDGHPPASGFRF